MNPPRRRPFLVTRRAAAALLLVTAMVPGAELRAAEPPVPDPQRVRWHQLRFTAAKLLARGTARIRLTEQPRGEAEARFIEAPGHRGIEAAGPRLIRLDLESAFGGRESKISLWLDPSNARALVRLKVRRGSKAYQKTWRFTTDGIFSHRRAPLGRNEANLPPEAWGKVEEEFRPHPETTDCPVVTTPTALFYLASATDLAVDDTLIFCAVSGKTLSRVEVRATDREALRVEYTRNTPHGPRLVRGDIETLRLVVTARTLEPQESAGEFEFLGLKGKIELFLDLEDRLPVEVRGRLPILGGVAVKLAEADLR